MAFMECHFHSDALGMACSMNVIMPEKCQTQIGMSSRITATQGAPVLYLLHGLSDDHSIWMRRTSVERYAAPLGLAVIMPCVHRSFYANMANGYRYWDFVSDELPAIARSMFKLSSRREDTFVAGLSMGGYGAFKLALSLPNTFAAAGSLSGALDIVGRSNRSDANSFPEDMRLVFGDMGTLRKPENDLLKQASNLAASPAPKPFLYQWCGTEDFLYKDNLSFYHHAQTIGLDVHYEEGPGDHRWLYWDTQLRRFLDLIVEKKLL